MSKTFAILEKFEEHVESEGGLSYADEGIKKLYSEKYDSIKEVNWFFTKH